HGLGGGTSRRPPVELLPGEPAFLHGAGGGQCKNGDGRSGGGDSVWPDRDRGDGAGQCAEDEQGEVELTASSDAVTPDVGGDRPPPLSGPGVGACLRRADHHEAPSWSGGI